MSITEHDEERDVDRDTPPTGDPIDRVYERVRETPVGRSIFRSPRASPP
jgi:hypothetical protein